MRGGVVRSGGVCHEYLSARAFRGSGEGFSGHRGERWWCLVCGARALWLRFFLGRHESRCLLAAEEMTGCAACRVALTTTFSRSIFRFNAANQIFRSKNNLETPHSRALGKKYNATFLPRTPLFFAPCPFARPRATPSRRCPRACPLAGNPEFFCRPEAVLPRASTTRTTTVTWWTTWWLLMGFPSHSTTP